MFIALVRTVLSYLVLIAAIRTMGKRQLGEMEPAEFVVTMLIANLAAVPMQDNSLPLLSGLIPILTVLATELILAGLSMKFLPVRRLLCGRPVPLIRDGRVLQANLRATRVSLEELTQRLRQKDVFDLAQVRHALLETDGSLSVLLRGGSRPLCPEDLGLRVPESPLPLPLISDGVVLAENLSRAGRDEAWLRRELKKRKLKIPEIFHLTVDEGGTIQWIRKELP